VLTPDLFLWGFFSGQDSQNYVEIRASAIILLRYVAAYNLFDALNLVFVNAIKGAGDTMFVFATSLTMAALLAVSTWVAMSYFDAGLHTCWGLITAWVWALGLIYLVRFLAGRWRSMRVIEMEVAEVPAG
jgi:MATE family multidrug resistance protein